MVIKSSYLHLYTYGYGWWTQHKWPTCLLPVLGFDPCSMFTSFMFPLSQWKKTQVIWGAYPNFWWINIHSNPKTGLQDNPPCHVLHVIYVYIYIYVFIKVLHGDRATNIVRGKQYSVGPAVWLSIYIFQTGKDLRVSKWDGTAVVDCWWCFFRFDIVWSRLFLKLPMFGPLVLR